MKNENEELDQMFANLTNQWDNQEPKDKHELRFLKKQKQTSFKLKLFLPLAIAALIMLFLFLNSLLA